MLAGMLAPAGTPKQIVAQLHQNVVRALTDTRVREQLASRGFDVTASTPDFFSEYLRQESDSAARLIRITGIKAE